MTVEGQAVELTLGDVEIATQDIPGWVVANEGSVTVALDITLTEELKAEGIARELVNRIQNIRKEGYDVTDRIEVELLHGEWDAAVEKHMEYICSETLCISFRLVESLGGEKQPIELLEGMNTEISIRKA
jgi:isoleucyl-tRNA synthetase